MVSSTSKHTLALKGWWYRYQHTKEVCPFIAYCVIEFEAVFHSLIFWQFLFLPTLAPNKNTGQFYVFYSIRNVVLIILYILNGYQIMKNWILMKVNINGFIVCKGVCQCWQCLLTTDVRNVVWFVTLWMVSLKLKRKRKCVCIYLCGVFCHWLLTDGIFHPAWYK